MKIKFIAHAGFLVSDDTTTIAIDPWFTSSEVNTPRIQCICPPHQTIDFQLPAAKIRPENVSGLKLILASHYHSHHAPLGDILELLKRAENPVFGGPIVEGARKQKLEENLHLGNKSAKLELLNDNTTLTVGRFKVRAFAHTHPVHLGFHITHPDGSFIHLADSQVNRDAFSRLIDPVFNHLSNSAPDFLSLTVGGHCSRSHFRGGAKTILEGTVFTAPEAARLTARINPKIASVMGVFNHSVFKNRVEYILPAAVVEDQFDWSLNYLRPSVQTLRLMPSLVLDINHTRNQRTVEFL